MKPRFKKLCFGAALLLGLQSGAQATYVGGNPLMFTDPEGLKVEVCERSVDISWIPGGGSRYLPSHSWLKTDSLEVGMGANCPVPGQACSDRPLDRTYTKNHSGQSTQANASCTLVHDVDEACVNEALVLGRYLGRWTPANQCQSFVQSVIDSCTTSGANRPYIGYPRP